jgi:hypothetical protein
MRVVSFIIAVVFGAPCPLGAQQAVPTSAPSPPAVPPGFEVPKDMSTYYLALYVKGPKYSIDQTPALNWGQTPITSFQRSPALFSAIVRHACCTQSVTARYRARRAGYLGSPAMRSEDAFLDEIAARMREAAARAGAVWCNNIALDAATPNALGLLERRRRRELGV